MCFGLTEMAYGMSSHPCVVCSLGRLKLIRIDGGVAHFGVEVAFISGRSSPILGVASVHRLNCRCRGLNPGSGVGLYGHYKGPCGIGCSGNNSPCYASYRGGDTGSRAGLVAYSYYNGRFVTMSGGGHSMLYSRYRRGGSQGGREGHRTHCVTRG